MENKRKNFNIKVIGILYLQEAASIRSFNELRREGRDSALGTDFAESRVAATTMASSPRPGPCEEEGEEVSSIVLPRDLSTSSLHLPSSSLTDFLTLYVRAKSSPEVVSAIGWDVVISVKGKISAA
jgi:hypothetical protein